MKTIMMKLYVIGFAALAVFFMIIIWKVTFAHVIEEYHDRQEALEMEKIKEQQVREKEKTTFQRIVLESEETVKHYLGYKGLEEKRVEGHFHHIGFDIGPDNRSYCIECHGDMPHDKIIELRAFLNMHAFFVGCQTCHVKLEGAEKTGAFKWYDRRTGVIIPPPDTTTRAGSYSAKIIPMEKTNGILRRIDSQERINFALEFKEKIDSLTEAQKQKAKKHIHSIVSKQPHICEDCHNSEKPLIQLETLGYPQERIDSILSTEVIGLIKNYTKFYMPRMLQPGEQRKEQKRKQEQKKRKTRSR
jgi:hypothetical protein